jgi:hypothetical protein
VKISWNVIYIYRKWLDRKSDEFLKILSYELYFKQFSNSLNMSTYNWVTLSFWNLMTVQWSAASDYLCSVIRLFNRRLILADLWPVWTNKILLLLKYARKSESLEDVDLEMWLRYVPERHKRPHRRNTKYTLRKKTKSRRIPKKTSENKLKINSIIANHFYNI